MFRQLALAAVMGLAWGTVGTAQERAEPQSRSGKDEPMTRVGVDRGFDRSSPAVGAALPDVAAFDAEGKEIRLSSLKGNYTVLVFGCLT